MKEIRKEMWTVGRSQEISADADADEGADADDDDDESIVSPLRVGDTIREIFKGDHNAAAVAARKLKRKQISALSGTLNYS